MPIKLSSSEARKILGGKASFSINTNKKGCVLRAPDNHANRGMEFERLINEANEVYRQKGIAVFTKIPTEFIISSEKTPSFSYGDESARQA